MKYLRQYIRQVIKESVDVPNLAVVTRESRGGDVIAVLYNADELEMTPTSRWKKDVVEDSHDVDLVYDVVRGFIHMGSPRGGGACDGAWVVFRSAGPGYGKAVYSVGYALSPSGRLMPDRRGVTDRAYRAWASAWDKGEYKKRPMDDDQHVHALRGNEYHTDDPADDCSTYPPYLVKHGRDPRVVNHTYEGTGGEPVMLAAMRARHEKIVDGDEVFRKAFERAMIAAGETFFDRHYGSGSPASF